MQQSKGGFNAGSRAPIAGMMRAAAAMTLAALSLYCGGRPPTSPEETPAPGVNLPTPVPSPTPTPAPVPSDPPVADPVPPVAPAPAPPPFTPPPAGSPVFVGAGDIAPCDAAGPEDTARLLDRISGTIFTLGDHAYPVSGREQLENCYHPTWGRHRDRTRATIGNHEYDIHGGAPFFEYFGASAGPGRRGYYSFQVGDWLAVVLDSMNGSSQQTSWLRSTLAATTSGCTVALWHHPFVSSGSHQTRSEVPELWRILYEHGADVVLTAHEHFYERFAPLNGAAVRDLQRGMRQFIVGTGGAPLYDFSAVHPNSEVRLRAHGVLKLTLGPTSYAWEFVSVTGASDAGTDACH